MPVGFEKIPKEAIYVQLREGETPTDVISKAVKDGKNIKINSDSAHYSNAITMLTTYGAVCLVVARTKIDGDLERSIQVYDAERNLDSVELTHMFDTRKQTIETNGA